MKLRILLVDDHQILREGLRALLSTEDDLQVVGEAADGRTAIDLARRLHPHVVVMDIGLPGISGIEATQKILETGPDVKVVGLSIYRDRGFVAGILGAGAKGYLPKNCASEELVKAIRAVGGGGIYISEQIKGVVVEDYVRQVQAKAQDAAAILSDREREVLCLLAGGQDLKHIAASLGLSYKTVEGHRQRITRKLGMRSVADLTRFAIREGLVSLDA
jgi:DNA-binding NarL/FixJ family response regulator